MHNLSNFENLTNICRVVFNQSDLIISGETCSNDVAGWDSFNHVMLIMEVEKFFGIKFALGELKDLKNIGALLDLIEKKQGS